MARFWDTSVIIPPTQSGRRKEGFAVRPLD